jgi:hypothetical protein
MVTQSRGIPSVRHPGAHYWTSLASDATGGALAVGPVAGSLSYYETLGGYEEVDSYRTSKSNTAEEQYENLSTRELKRGLRAEYQTRYDNGHEFYSFKRRNSLQSTKIEMSNASGWRIYVGPVWPKIDRVMLSPYPDLVSPSNSERMADGARAIERTAPTAPEAGLAQFLGELREKLPAVVGLASYREGVSAKALGGEHLNVQFGIKPFTSDIQKLARQVLTFRKVLAQFKRDAGAEKHLRRRTTISEGHDTSVVSEALPIPNGMTTLSGSEPWSDYSTSDTSLYRVYDTQNSKAWFSGAFTYHLAEATDFLSKLERYEQMANNLLGSRFGVDTFWELTPWSWLIDWELDVGGFLHNIELLHNDSLVLRYGYVMHENHAERIYSATSPLIDRKGNRCGVPMATYSVHRKQRSRATPYGFGLNVDSFNPRQWAILGALGLTKTPGKLRIS